MEIDGICFITRSTTLYQLSRNLCILDAQTKRITISNLMCDRAKCDVNVKWDACLDLTVRRFVYTSLAGAFSGSPITCWASVAFGAGIGVGSSAYIETSYIFNGPPPPTTRQQDDAHVTAIAPLIV
ncbi:hypothetical protein ACFE04_005216 [Oxalis oulophora]